MAIVSGPLGKVSHVELQMSQSEVFFGGGWSQFLVLHDITESNALLLRYEGNMVFTVKVFEPDGCQRESKYKDIKMQQSEQKMNKFLDIFNLDRLYSIQRMNVLEASSSNTCHNGIAAIKL